MIGKVKKWLGIEGVKLEILLPDDVDSKSGMLRGMLRFQSMNLQTVTEIRVVLVERYSRGRGEERTTDEYLMGSLLIEDIFVVKPDEIVERPFTLKFDRVQSAVDSFGDKNFVFGGLASVARWTRAAKSEFRVEGEAKVQGVALNPFDKKTINLT